MDVLLAIHPALIIAPVVLGTAGVGLGAWWFTRGKRRELPEPKTPGVLPPGPEPPPAPTPIGELVDAYVGVYEDGAFHEVQAGDGVIKLVTNVLNRIDPGAGGDKNMRAALGALVNASQWNRDLMAATTTDDPYRDDQNVGIHPHAFRPRHENMIGAMRSGYFPRRNIDAQGNKAGPGSSWAAPWIPALNHDAVRNRAADPAMLLAPPWEDGSPATEPPPELLDALQER